MPSPPLADLAASFRRHLRAAGKADRTIRLYDQAIRFYVDWLVAHGREPSLENLTRKDLAAWLADLSQRVGVETVRTRVRGMRRFCRWLASEGEVDKAATDGIEMPTKPESPVRVFTNDEVAALLKAVAVPRGKPGAFDWRIFDGRRDEVIVRLLLDCGLRVSELAGITLDLVDIDQDAVYVVGKGSRPRVVPFGARTGQAIDRYLRVRQQHPRVLGINQLLLGQRGAITADGIRWRLELLAEATGIPGVHPHAFRHTFAHRWLSAGGQERDLMRLAGWRSDAMLSVYARSTADVRAHEAHRRMALGDQI